MYDNLVRELQCCPDGEYGCPQCEHRTSLHCRETLMRQAADAIEELEYALILMVLQYCTTDDGLLFHEFMSAGENAFAVLGLENGQQEAPLWHKMDRIMQSVSERVSAKTVTTEGKE